MGYQALLFCPDEKLARIISQVFNELDFSVSPVHEPFAAVKQLMTQRYDAIVVDCDNEQNASLLFRSARNSNSNQSSLAFALVEGQTGVAKAYRIGANLVLTKPINVEQAKGTLRIARGLLRKGSDPLGAVATSACGTGMAAKVAPAPRSIASAGTPLNAALSATARPGTWVEFGSSSPAVTAAATQAAASHESVSHASVAHASVARTAVAETGDEIAILDDEPAVIAPPADPAAAHQIKIATTVAADARPAASATASSHATLSDDVLENVAENETAKPAIESKAAPAAAPTIAAASKLAVVSAPAQETVSSTAKGNKVVEAKPAPRSRTTASRPAASVPMWNPVSTTSAQAFGALSEEDSGESGHNRKILIAALIILALAALGYFSDGRLIRFGTAPASQPASAPQDSAKPAPTVRPTSSPVETPAVSGSSVASSATPTSAPPAATSRATPPAGFAHSLANRIAATFEWPSESKKKKADSEAARDRGQSAATGTKEQAEDSPPSPSTLVATSANNTSLSSLMSSASYNVSKPSLATLRVSQGVSQGLLIKRVQPKYPASALAVRTQGSVQIEATIDKEGNVVNPKVLKGDPVLARAALDAVRQWRYKPYYLDGSPVEIETQITINFKAD
jgi:TonB family protein